MKSFSQYITEVTQQRKRKKEENNLRNLKGRLKAVQGGGKTGISTDTEEKLKKSIAQAEHGVKLYGGNTEENMDI